MLAARSCKPCRYYSKAVVARGYATSHVVFVCYRLVYSSLGCCSSAPFYRLGSVEQLPAVVTRHSQVGGRLGVLAELGSYRRSDLQERQSNTTQLTESRGAFAHDSRHSAASYVSRNVALLRQLRLAEPPFRRFCQTQLARAPFGVFLRALAGSGPQENTSALHVADCFVLVALGSHRPSTLS